MEEEDSPGTRLLGFTIEKGLLKPYLKEISKDYQEMLSERNTLEFELLELERRVNKIRNKETKISSRDFEGYKALNKKILFKKNELEGCKKSIKQLDSIIFKISFEVQMNPKNFDKETLELLESIEDMDKYQKSYKVRYSETFKQQMKDDIFKDNRK